MTRLLRLLMLVLLGCVALMIAYGIGGAAGRAETGRLRAAVMEANEKATAWHKAFTEANDTANIWMDNADRLQTQRDEMRTIVKWYEGMIGKCTASVKNSTGALRTCAPNFPHGKFPSNPIVGDMIRGLDDELYFFNGIWWQPLKGLK